MGLLADYPRESNAAFFYTNTCLLYNQWCLKTLAASKVMADCTSKFKDTCQAAYRWISQPSFVHRGGGPDDIKSRLAISMQGGGISLLSSYSLGGENKNKLQGTLSLIASFMMSQTHEILTWTVANFLDQQQWVPSCIQLQESVCTTNGLNHSHTRNSKKAS